jgi:hypothetical protein
MGGFGRFLAAMIAKGSDMRSIRLAAAFVLGVSGTAAAQSNAAGTSNGTFENPKPTATLFGAIFGPASSSDADHRDDDVDRQRTALQAIIHARSLDEAKKLAADALK